MSKFDTKIATAVSTRLTLALVGGCAFAAILFGQNRLKDQVETSTDQAISSTAITIVQRATVDLTDQARELAIPKGQSSRLAVKASRAFPERSAGARILSLPGSARQYSRLAPIGDELDRARFSSLLSRQGAGVKRVVGWDHILTLDGTNAYVEGRNGLKELKHFDLAALWSVTARSPGGVPSDASVAHDSELNRWGVAAVANPGLPGSAIFLAVSENDDPAGRWRVYRIEPDRHEWVWPGSPTVLFGRGQVFLNVTWHPIQPGTAHGADVRRSAGRTETYSVGEAGAQAIKREFRPDAQSGPPQPTYLNPNSGLGARQRFSVSYTDLNGVADISEASLLFNSNLDGANACWVIYYPGSNQLGLVNNAVTAVSLITPNTAGSVQNSQCTLNGSTSYVNTNATGFSIIADLTFSLAFGGTKSIYMDVQSATTGDSQWQAWGAWQVPVTVVSPFPSYLSPSSGEDATQTFYGYFSAANGAAAITQASLLFNSALNGAAACWVIYYGNTNQIGLVNDAVTAVSFVTPGSTGTAQNSQCTLNGSGSSVYVSDDQLFSHDQLIFGPALTFNASFGGVKSIYLDAAIGAKDSGWQLEGSWIVPSSLLPPQPESLSPSSGLGTTNQFYAKYSDPNAAGYADISQASLLFNSALNGANSCWVVYYPATQQFGLVNDSATAVSYVNAFANSTLQNSQCTLEASDSYANGSQSSLSLNIDLSFSAAFGGTQSVYMDALGTSGLDSGWKVLGNWQVPVTGVAPFPNYVSPSSGTGTTNTFSAYYSDLNGYTAITQASLLINSSLNGASACWVFYDGGSNQLGLVNDAGNGSTFVQIGSNQTAQNSQCILNGRGSYVSGSGTQLTVQAAITFINAGFGGVKTIYSEAISAAGNSNWHVAGSWTVQ